MIAVVANGNIEDIDWLKLCLGKADVIIAADGGAKHVLACQLFPHYLIGDLDSLSEEEVEKMASNHVEIIRYPPDKDETDLELAFLNIIESPQLSQLGVPVELFGALGGRIDQTLANIMLLTHDKIHDLDVVVREPYQRVWVIDRSITVTGHIGDKLSLIPLTKDIKVKNTTNLKWPLVNERLDFGPARGISNVMTDRESSIEIDADSGFLLCIHTDKSWSR